MIAGWSGRGNYGQELDDIHCLEVIPSLALRDGNKVSKSSVMLLLLLLQTNFIEDVQSSFATDMGLAMKSFFDNPAVSDVVFIVDSQRIHAVRIILLYHCLSVLRDKALIKS